MKTNELKKGDWIILRGLNWRGEMWDNMRGNTRVVDVYGWEHEAGSVYSHDILYKIVPLEGKTLPLASLKDATIRTEELLDQYRGMAGSSSTDECAFALQPIEHTDKQLKLKGVMDAYSN